jgi:integrase
MPSSSSLNTAGEVGSTPTCQREFDAAFDAWLAQRQAQLLIRQRSSALVYRSMWDAFAHWCVARERRLGDVVAADIRAFMAARSVLGELSDRHAWRLLSLLDAVLRQNTRALDEAGNRAALQVLASRPEWQFANASERDPLPDFLPAPQARQLVVWLLDPQNPHQCAGARAHSWQALRNRTAVALQLGAGLTPGDVRAALVGGVLGDSGRRSIRPWRLRVPRHGAVAERDAPLAPWASRLLAQWLAARSSASLPGDLLFPGTRKGSAWAKVAQYQAANAVLHDAGVEGAGRGSFVLRHTFALRQLRRGHAPEDVARWLGVSDPGVMARYERVLVQAADLI